jgi:hypothetical protein
MCTRFTTVRVNVTGSTNDVGVEPAGQLVGPVPGGVPIGARAPVDYRPVADIVVELADVTVGDPTNERHVSVLTLGVQAL